MSEALENTAAGTFEFLFEDRKIQARECDTVAAALLVADVWIFRLTPEKGRPRGPFCMMGICFDCLVEIDGQPNRQACQVMARPGMNVRIQSGVASVVPGGGGDCAT